MTNNPFDDARETHQVFEEDEAIEANSNSERSTAVFDPFKEPNPLTKAANLAVTEFILCGGTPTAGQQLKKLTLLLVHQWGSKREQGMLGLEESAEYYKDAIIPFLKVGLSSGDGAMKERCAKLIAILTPPPVEERSEEDILGIIQKLKPSKSNLMDLLNGKPLPPEVMTETQSFMSASEARKVLSRIDGPMTEETLAKQTEKLTKLMMEDPVRVAKLLESWKHPQKEQLIQAVKANLFLKLREDWNGTLETMPKVESNPSLFPSPQSPFLQRYDKVITIESQKDWENQVRREIGKSCNKQALQALEQLAPYWTGNDVQSLVDGLAPDTLGRRFAKLPEVLDRVKDKLSPELRSQIVSTILDRISKPDLSDSYYIHHFDSASRNFDFETKIFRSDKNNKSFAPNDYASWRIDGLKILASLQEDLKPEQVVTLMKVVELPIKDVPQSAATKPDSGVDSLRELEKLIGAAELSKLKSEAAKLIMTLPKEQLPVEYQHLPKALSVILSPDSKNISIDNLDSLSGLCGVKPWSDKYKATEMLLVTALGPEAVQKLKIEALEKLQNVLNDVNADKSLREEAARVLLLCYKELPTSMVITQMKGMPHKVPENWVVDLANTIEKNLQSDTLSGKEMFQRVIANIDYVNNLSPALRARLMGWTNLTDGEKSVMGWMEPDKDLKAKLKWDELSELQRENIRWMNAKVQPEMILKLMSVNSLKNSPNAMLLQKLDSNDSSTMATTKQSYEAEFGNPSERLVQLKNEIATLATDVFKDNPWTFEGVVQIEKLLAENKLKEALEALDRLPGGLFRNRRGTEKLHLELASILSISAELKEDGATGIAETAREYRLKWNSGDVDSASKLAFQLVSVYGRALEWMAPEIWRDLYVRCPLLPEGKSIAQYQLERGNIQSIELPKYSTDKTEAFNQALGLRDIPGNPPYKLGLANLNWSKFDYQTHKTLAFALIDTDPLAAKLSTIAGDISGDLTDFTRKVKEAQEHQDHVSKSFLEQLSKQGRESILGKLDSVSQDEVDQMRARVKAMSEAVNVLSNKASALSREEWKANEDLRKELAKRINSYKQVIDVFDRNSTFNKEARSLVGFVTDGKLRPTGTWSWMKDNGPAIIGSVAAVALTLATCGVGGPILGGLLITSVGIAGAEIATEFMFKINQGGYCGFGPRVSNGAVVCDWLRQKEKGALSGKDDLEIIGDFFDKVGSHYGKELLIGWATFLVSGAIVGRIAGLSKQQTAALLKNPAPNAEKLALKSAQAEGLGRLPGATGEFMKDFLRTLSKEFSVNLSFALAQSAGEELILDEIGRKKVHEAGEEAERSLSFGVAIGLACLQGGKLKLKLLSQAKMDGKICKFKLEDGVTEKQFADHMRVQGFEVKKVAGGKWELRAGDAKPGTPPFLMEDTGRGKGEQPADLTHPGGKLEAGPVESPSVKVPERPMPRLEQGVHMSASEVQAPIHPAGTVEGGGKSVLSYDRAAPVVLAEPGGQGQPTAYSRGYAVAEKNGGATVIRFTERPQESRFAQEQKFQQGDQHIRIAQDDGVSYFFDSKARTVLKVTNSPEGPVAIRVENFKITALSAAEMAQLRPAIRTEPSLKVTVDGQSMEIAAAGRREVVIGPGSRADIRISDLGGGAIMTTDGKGFYVRSTGGAPVEVVHADGKRTTVPANEIVALRATDKLVIGGKEVSLMRSESHRYSVLPVRDMGTENRGAKPVDMTKTPVVSEIPKGFVYCEELPGGNRVRPRVFDAARDPVLQQFEADAMSKFAHLKGNDAALMQALTDYVHERMTPRVVDEGFGGQPGIRQGSGMNKVAGRLDSNGEHIMVGDLIARRSAVCLDQAMVLKYLAQKMGIKAEVTTGTWNGQPHAWVTLTGPGAKRTIYDPRNNNQLFHNERSGLPQNKDYRPYGPDHPRRVRERALAGDMPTDYSSIKKQIAEVKDALDGHVNGNKIKSAERDAFMAALSESLRVSDPQTLKVIGDRLGQLASAPDLPQRLAHVTEVLKDPRAARIGPPIETLLDPKTPLKNLESFNEFMKSEAVENAFDAGDSHAIQQFRDNLSKLAQSPELPQRLDIAKQMESLFKEVPEFRMDFVLDSNISLPKLQEFKAVMDGMNKGDMIFAYFEVVQALRSAHPEAARHLVENLPEMVKKFTSAEDAVDKLTALRVVAESCRDVNGLMQLPLFLEQRGVHLQDPSCKAFVDRSMKAGLERVLDDPTNNYMFTVAGEGSFQMLRLMYESHGMLNEFNQIVRNRFENQMKNGQEITTQEKQWLFKNRDSLGIDQPTLERVIRYEPPVPKLQFFPGGDNMVRVLSEHEFCKGKFTNFELVGTTDKGNHLIKCTDESGRTNHIIVQKGPTGEAVTFRVIDMEGSPIKGDPIFVEHLADLPPEVMKQMASGLYGDGSVRRQIWTCVSMWNAPALLANQR